MNMNKKDIFKYNRILKPICEKLTYHKYREIVGCTNNFVDRGYKYPNRSDFYYKCKICGYLYFNNHPTKKEIEKIKKWSDFYEKER